MQYLLTKNNGYKWFNYNKCFFRGYIQTKDNIVLKGYDAIHFFMELSDYGELIQKLKKKYMAFFSIIVEKDEEIWGAVDIARSMPIYYSTDGKIISDDSELIRDHLKIDRQDTNAIRLLELYQSFFVGYGNTVYDRIMQLCAGQCFRIYNGQISAEYYYLHNAKPVDYSWKEALTELENNTKKMMTRMKGIVNDRTVVLSLSGGHDSRYLACAMKQNGFSNVVCYTYGKKDSLEVRSACAISKGLGYKWINIEYTDQDIKNILKNSDYLEYCEQHDSIPYLQNYIAVRKIKENKLVPDDSVFVSGLCNDMPSGQYIRKEESINQYSFSSKGLADYIYDNRFVRSKIANSAQNKLKREILQDIHQKQLKIEDYQSFIHGIDSVVTDYEHTRRFLKMNLAHEFFGYEWILPCWDKDLLKLWYEMPVEFRIEQRLYNEYLRIISMRNAVKEYKVFGAAYSHNQTLFKIKRYAGGALVRFMYSLGRPLKRKEDINNFAPLEIELYKLIKNKKPILMQYAGLLYLLGVYTIENRYGEHWYKSVFKIMKE